MRLKKLLGGKIPKDYHTNEEPDYTLCLGASPAIYERFYKEPNIKNFIEKILIPYLYRYSFIKKYNKEPFQDLRHGGAGLIDFYKDYLKLNNTKQILALLESILINNYNAKNSCPCGSGLQIDNCHYSQMQLLYSMPKKIIMKDLKNIVAKKIGFEKNSSPL